MSVAQRNIQGMSVREPQVPFVASAKNANAEAASTRYLRVALILVGVAFIVGIYTFTKIWPSGWAWHATGTSYYLQMIMGVYATLGVFLLVASRKPLEHLSLIWFTVWSSVVHAGIMGTQAIVNPEHIAHLWGDVPALLLFAGLLAFLTRKSTRAKAA